MNEIEIINSTRLALDEAAAGELVAQVLAAEGVDGAELALTFVGERRMRALNHEYRQRDEVTDVLSFPLEEADEERFVDDPSPRLLGDVVICSRQALRQAAADGTPPGREIAVLIVHGVLHLLGYDHECDHGEMLERQDELAGAVGWESLLVAPR